MSIGMSTATKFQKKTDKNTGKNSGKNIQQRPSNIVVHTKIQIDHTHKSFTI